jgi:hypothetical protein
MDASIKEQYSGLFDAWWSAGGWKNFASFLVATGNAQISNQERRELVNDRLESATKEATGFLNELPL